MMLPWKKPPEERTITTTITKREAKVVARMRATKVAKTVTGLRVGLTILYFILGITATMVWSSTQNAWWVVLLMFAIAILMLTIFTYDRDIMKERKAELRRMEIESKVQGRHVD